MTREHRGESSVWFRWVPLAISIAALAVSFWNSFSPANISISLSSPQLVLRPLTVRAVNGGISGSEVPQALLGLKFTCAFSNSGAQNGIVENMAVRFQSEDDQTKWLFSPYMVVDDAKFLGGSWNDLTWLKSSFYPITVPGKQTAALSVLFFSESGLPGFKSVEIRPHRFKVTILTWTSGSSSWHEQQTFTLNFDQDVIRFISAGTIFNIPFAEVQQRFQLPCRFRRQTLQVKILQRLLQR